MNTSYLLPGYQCQSHPFYWHGNEALTSAWGQKSKL